MEINEEDPLAKLTDRQLRPRGGGKRSQIHDAIGQPDAVKDRWLLSHAKQLFNQSQSTDCEQESQDALTCPTVDHQPTKLQQLDGRPFKFIHE